MMLIRMALVVFIVSLLTGCDNPFDIDEDSRIHKIVAEIILPETAIDMPLAVLKIPQSDFDRSQITLFEETMRRGEPMLPNEIALQSFEIERYQ